MVYVKQNIYYREFYIIFDAITESLISIEVFLLFVLGENNPHTESEAVFRCKWSDIIDVLAHMITDRLSGGLIYPTLIS